jgi:hypothetical protein
MLNLKKKLLISADDFVTTRFIEKSVSRDLLVQFDKSS